MKSNLFFCDNCIFRQENAIKYYCNNPESPNYKRSPMPNQRACIETNQKLRREDSLIARMKHNIRAYNKHMTKQFLRKKTPIELLNMVHDLDRREFAIELAKEHLVKTADIKSYLSK